jgi:excinuclease ABC subunit A
VRQAREVYRDVPDIARRLAVLDEVGLGYLRLGQPAPTLSGGEAQRLKLAAHLGVRGRGAHLFLLDEPTTGLHLQDIEVLVRLLDRLVAAGHTVVVIEHNPELVAAADWIVTLGPGAGPAGGRVVAMGPPGAAASARLPVPARASRARGPG